MRTEVDLPPGVDLDRVPDGVYAVLDPTRPDTLTAWLIDRRRLTPYPAGQRWAPRCPWFPGVDRARRRELTEAWYRGPYDGWKAAVVAQIAADPAAAAEAFARAYPGPPRRALPPAVEERRRDREELAAAHLDLGSRHLAEIAAALGLPPAVAFRRVQAGRERRSELLDVRLTVVGGGAA